MDKVLITGGSGFIANCLKLYSCPLDDYDLWCMSHYSYDNADWDQADWDYIIHLAPVPVDRVLECAQRCGAKVLLASSGGVYDRQPNDYFKMKLEDENKLIYSRVDCRIARIFTTCGARMDWKRYAIGNFILQAQAGGPLDVWSRGLVVRSYMYGSDLAEWLWKILLEGRPGSRYNVGSDVPHSTLELAHEVACYFDPPPPIEVRPSLEYEARPYYVPDISRPRDELGLSITVPFDEAIRRTVEDYRNE